MADIALEGHVSGQKLTANHQARIASPVAQELELLKQDLAGATAVVDKIKARMNALAPINRLPFEVLTHIFSILSEELRPLARLKPIRSPRLWRLGWIVVTHICKHWRDLAVACPSLWKLVIFSLGRPWAQCMLIRSKQFPISIDAYLGYLVPLDIICILGHLAHTQSLSLIVEGYSEALRPFMTILALPAPMLRVLRLEYTKKILSVKEVINAPHNLFADTVSALRHVQLRNVFVPWTSHIFSRLHHLSVIFPFSHSFRSHRPWALSIGRLLDILKTMPDLRVLALEGCLPLVDPGSTEKVPPGDHRIALPQLTSLKLGGYINSVMLVLGHLAPSPGVKLDFPLVGIEEPSMEGRLLQLWSLLSSILAPGGVPVSFDILNAGFKDAFYITGSTTEGATRLKLTFDTGIHCATVLKSFLSTFPLDRIPTVKLYDFSMFDETWHSVFHHPVTSTVESLTLERECDFGGFVKFLGGGGNSEEGLPLRSLRSVTLIRTTWNWNGEPRHLKQALQTRKARGMPLQKMVIDWQNDDLIEDTWERAFDGIVPEVFVHYEVFEDEDEV